MVDDHTVRVDLTQPWAAFPSSFLDGQSAVMMAPAMLKSSDQGQAHPIGTGPFTFVSWQPGSDFVTRRNPTYWQPGLPHLDKLTFKVITDSTTQMSALKAGDVDLVFSASAQSADDLAGQYAELRDWSTEPGMAMTNTLPEIAGRANPMANRHACLALAYATDQKALVAGIAPGLQIPTSPFPPSSPWGMPQNQNGYPSFDLSRARSEVAQYKRESGQSSLRITLATPGSRGPAPGGGAAGAVEGGRNRHPGRGDRPDDVHHERGGRRLPGRHLQHLQLARPRPEPLLLVGRDRARARQGQHQLHAVHDAADAGRSEGGSRAAVPAWQACRRRPRTPDQRGRGEHLDHLDAVLAHRRVEGPRLDVAGPIPSATSNRRRGSPTSGSAERAQPALRCIPP